jgi:phosphate acetyltransferase
VYVAAVEPDSGKAVVALGVMELLAGRTERVGFFRPVVSGPEPDRLVELMRQRYGLGFEPAELVGLTYDELHELTAAGRTDEVVARVVERFRAVESRCDAVLCVGSDFTDVAAPTELALNLRLAENLGAAVIAVVSGRGKAPEDVVAAMAYARRRWRSSPTGSTRRARRRSGSGPTGRT